MQAREMWWYSPYDPESDWDEEENFMGSLGSGNVEYTEGRKMIHFGSPAEDEYDEPTEISNVKRNISVKDWLENHE